MPAYIYSSSFFHYTVELFNKAIFSTGWRSKADGVKAAMAFSVAGELLNLCS